MTIPIFQVDAFTAEPFGGNPAAVCVLSETADDSWMQAVAHEMNLSETAFLLAADDGYNLRWFTPATEVDLCGHATLASAHVLWETGALSAAASARFHSRSGLLIADRRVPWIQLDFPSKPARPVSPPPALLTALGTDALTVGQNEFDYIVELESEVRLRSITPDFAGLVDVTERGVMVTSRSQDERFDFVSRFFAPAFGINEDPVTGSAHCCLGPFWAERLGKTELMAYQASPRGGVVRVTVAGDRVLLGGQAVTVSCGELLV